MAYLRGQFEDVVDGYDEDIADRARIKNLMELYAGIDQRNHAVCEACEELDVDYSDDDYIYEWPEPVDNKGNFYKLDTDVSVNMKYMAPEFYDLLEVVEFGAKKHDKPGGAANWASKDGNKSSHKDMHASMFRHLAESSAGVREDEDTGLDPLLHLATRALMMYTRIKRGLIHLEDE